MTWEEALHPRDEQGRFAPSEGGGAWMRVAESRDLNGRDALHDRITTSVLAGGVPTATPTITMLGGGPASGKSSLVEDGFLEDPGSVHVDPDEIKGMIPEYRQMVDIGGDTAKGASTFVHEEASALSKEIMAAGLENAYSMTYDTTGDGAYENLEAKVSSWRTAGAQRVDAVYATVDVDEAWRRSVDRFEQTGRYVPETYLRETYRLIPETVSRAVENRLFDNFRLYSTKDNTQLIAEYRNRGDLQIYDQSAWTQFVGVR